MKKTYINPQLLVISMKSSQAMLIGSLPKGDGSIGDNGKVLSPRRHRYEDWDDEDEEDF